LTIGLIITHLTSEADISRFVKDFAAGKSLIHNYSIGSPNPCDCIACFFNLIRILPTFPRDYIA
ncbi:MAG: hypothetical protein ACNA7V_08770, partial [Bacteroidales bacterium]